MIFVPNHFSCISSLAYTRRLFVTPPSATSSGLLDRLEHRPFLSPPRFAEIPFDSAPSAGRVTSRETNEFVVRSVVLVSPVILLRDSTRTIPTSVSGRNKAERLGNEMQRLWISVFVLSVLSQGQNLSIQTHSGWTAKFQQQQSS
jgi:hypothetical protein